MRRKNFANKDWVKVPKIDWEHTTSEVLTMEYCPGIKINRADQLDAKVRNTFGVFKGSELGVMRRALHHLRMFRWCMSELCWLL